MSEKPKLACRFYKTAQGTESVREWLLGLTSSVRKAIGYFETNRERMRYRQFRRQDLFVGSGVVEAGCKSVIGQRFKQSGMRWTVAGANQILALRCCQLSGRWEDFWERRRTA